MARRLTLSHVAGRGNARTVVTLLTTVQSRCGSFSDEQASGAENSGNLEAAV